MVASEGLDGLLDIPLPLLRNLWGGIPDDPWGDPWGAIWGSVWGVHLGGTLGGYPSGGPQCVPWGYPGGIAAASWG